VLQTRAKLLPGAGVRATNDGRINLVGQLEVMLDHARQHRGVALDSCAKRRAPGDGIALVAGILTLLTGLLWLGANWAGVYSQKKGYSVAEMRQDPAVVPEAE